MKSFYLVFLLLVGCGHSIEKEYIEVPVFSPVVCENFGRIDQINTLPVVYVEAKDSKGNNVLGLRGDQYSNLAIIIRDTLRYIGEQKKAISYYKKCIEDHNSTPLNEEGESE
jgi:hypothetical protein